MIVMMVVFFIVSVWKCIRFVGIVLVNFFVYL